MRTTVSYEQRLHMRAELLRYLNRRLAIEIQFIKHWQPPERPTETLTVKLSLVDLNNLIGDLEFLRKEAEAVSEEKV